jgi:VCBS repeat-containing protein
MSVKGPDFFDIKDLLSAPLRRNPMLRDLAEVCNQVLGREVEERRRRLAKSRESVKNRKGDIISQIKYLPEDDKPALEFDTGNPVVIETGELIPKAKILRVISNIGLQGAPSAIDYFEVEFVSKSGKRARWFMPIDAPQERDLLIKNSYMLGFDFFNTKLSSEDYERLYEYLGMFWPENGLNDQFIKFIGFIKNMKLEMVPLWSVDDGTDIISILEEFSSDVHPASLGGSWYLTSHVEVRYDLKKHNSDYPIDFDELERLFYLFAPIMLVMERIVGSIDEIINIGVGVVTQAEIINYGQEDWFNPTIYFKTYVALVVQSAIYNYGISTNWDTEIINTPPTITSANVFNVVENSTTIATLTATDPDAGAILNWAIVGGDDATKFDLNSLTGDLAFIAAPDFENPTDADTNNVYVIKVLVTDDIAEVNQTITVNVLNINEAPIITSPNSFSAAENNTVIAGLTATDPEGAGLTWSIIGGADRTKFNLTSNGILTFISSPDYENPTDANTDNIYELQVQVSDGTLTTNQNISVTVTDISETITDIVLSGNTIAENSIQGTVVGILFSTGGSPPYTYSFVAPNNNAGGRFQISGNSLQVGTTNIDYETSVSHAITIRSLDAASHFYSKNLNITVINVNEAPTITSSSTFNVVENTSTVATLSATDPEGNGLIWSIIGGTDGAKFNINSSTGALSFIAAPNFETPTDANADNIYVVQIQVSDGTNTTNQTINVTVANANEAPVITSNNTFSIAENNTVITTLTATDPDVGATLLWSIIGGADSAKFNINASTGDLFFATAPNFEIPTDANADNVYVVQVQVSDGTLTANQIINVTVTNINEAPVITSATTFSMAENNTAVATLAATDPEGTGLTWSIVGGLDQAKFTINSSTGALSFVTAPDYEAPTDSDANNIYNVTVRASDGINNTNQTINVTVTDIAEGSNFWRVYVTDTGGAAFMQWGEIQMMDVVGGTNQCSGGTAYASAGIAANAFDGNNTTICQQAAVVGNWVAYQFPSLKSIKEIKLVDPNANGYMPKAFKVQKSNDSTNGSNGTWTDVWSVGDQVNWLDYPSFPITRRYVDPAYWSYTKNKYRLTGSNGTGNAVRIAAFELRISGIDQAPGSLGTPSAISFQIGFMPYYAFDADNSTFWGSTFGFGSTNRWIRYDLPEGKNISQFAVTAHPTDATYSPTSFIIEESPDGITWTTIITASGLTWANGETKIFNRP